MTSAERRDLELPEVGPWGPDDQAGAANEVTPQRLLDALALVRGGRVFDLSMPLSTASPRMPVVQSPYSLCLWSNPYVGQGSYEREGARNGVSFADERVTLDLHTGTHIDALAHAWIGDRTYNGLRMEEVVDNWGLRKLGIEHLPPLLTRGVLLDIPRAVGRALEPGEVVGPDELETASRQQGAVVQPGDIVLIRTGWGAFWGVDNDTYLRDSPGLGIEGARWLTDRGVAVAGADTMLLEVYPPEAPEIQYPVHQHLLARAGTYIIEQAALDELARAEAFEFLCVCTAPKFEGATAAPVRLTAVT
jgi:kynurenine formamidase